MPKTEDLLKSSNWEARLAEARARRAAVLADREAPKPPRQKPWTDSVEAPVLSADDLPDERDLAKRPNKPSAPNEDVRARRAAHLSLAASSDAVRTDGPRIETLRRATGRPPRAGLPDLAPADPPSATEAPRAQPEIAQENVSVAAASRMPRWSAMAAVVCALALIPVPLADADFARVPHVPAPLPGVAPSFATAVAVPVAPDRVQATGPRLTTAPAWRAPHHAPVVFFPPEVRPDAVARARVDGPVAIEVAAQMRTPARPDIGGTSGAPDVIYPVAMSAPPAKPAGHDNVDGGPRVQSDDKAKEAARIQVARAVPPSALFEAPGLSGAVADELVTLLPATFARVEWAPAPRQSITVYAYQSPRIETDTALIENVRVQLQALSVPVGTQTLDLAMAQPDVTVVARPEPVSVRPEAAAKDAAPAMEAAPDPVPVFAELDVTVLMPEQGNERALEEAVARVTTEGNTLLSAKKVPHTISATQVRYFHDEDRASAEALALSMGAALRDFTDLSPSPPAGRAELWLSGEGAPPKPVRVVRAPRPSVAAPAPQPQPVVTARQSLLERLLSGDSRRSTGTRFATREDDNDDRRRVAVSVGSTGGTSAGGAGASTGDGSTGTGGTDPAPGPGDTGSAGGGDTGSTGDSGSTGTGGTDTGGSTGGTDTGGSTGGSDTGGGTGGTDTGGTDTGGSDTGGSDTGSSDTGSSDTGGSDTGGSGDSGGSDAGGSDDSGGSDVD
ncbi:MAG: hypothetical protein AAFR35_12175 [Pseudomonadota bacterium]